MQNDFKHKGSEKYLLLLFSLLFIISIVVFKDFLLLRKLYIYTDTGCDTLNQYWPIYQNFIGKIKSGEFPLWSFNMGIGTSALSVSTLLFDPFNVILIFVKISSIPYALAYIAVLKIILSGLFFYLLLTQIVSSKFSAIIGSILYGFSGYMIVWGQHYFFATALVLFSLSLLAYELWLKGEKRFLFPISIGLTAIFSMYFLYMYSIFLAIYAFFRYLSMQEFNFKDFFKFVFSALRYYILGIGLSAMISIPQFFVLLNSPRVSNSTNKIPLFSFDTLGYYVTCVFRFLSNDSLGSGNNFIGVTNYYEAPTLYCGILSVLLLPQIFKFLKLKNRKIVLSLLLLLTVFLSFPFFSSMFNAFKDVTYRWTFVITIFLIIMATISLSSIDKDRNIDGKLLTRTYFSIVFVVLAATYIGHVNLDWHKIQIYNILSSSKWILIFLTIYTILLPMMKYKKVKKIIKAFLILFVCIEVGMTSYSTVNRSSAIDSSYLKTSSGYYDNTNEVIKYLNSKDKDFYRIDKDYFSVSFNDSLIQEYKGLYGYDSVNQPSYVNFIKEMDLRTYSKSLNYVMADGLKIKDLLGVKYYLTKDSGKSNFLNTSNNNFIKSFGDINLYEKQNYLPLGFTYNKYIKKQDFDKIPIEQKDDMLLKAVVIENNSSSTKALIDYNVLNIPVSSLKSIKLKENDIQAYNIKIKSGVLWDNLKFDVVKNAPYFVINLNTKESEVSGIKVEMNMKSELDTDGQLLWANGTKNFSVINTKKFIIKKGTNKYTLYINNSNINALRLDVGTSKTSYEINDFIVHYKVLTDYKSDLDKLKVNTLKIDNYSDNYINGKVTVDSDKLLFLSIPYDKGWQVYIDGKKGNLEKVNIGFCGLMLKQGTHTVKLRYLPYGFKSGIFITCISIIILLFLLKNNKNMNSNKKKKNRKEQIY